MRLRERAGEWWIEVRPGPSWGGEEPLVRAVAGGGWGGEGTHSGHFAGSHFLGHGRLARALPDVS
jgi:hypothetical protein